MGKNIAIKVENLSKAYQLGQIGTGTISRDLERFWTTKIRGKEDPFLKIGQTNDRTVKGESDIVWSLKDINFEIEQGDAVGIIGRNGAGKSTLLKLLSRVTAPTTGNIKVKGRIASLLEVGTGFHPELTGRENIYLNGAILGMRKKEITRKFDEIVDFSGVERYIDTPVKRYSSGMYVRLAFAVAAHLESEILIVDEVLAVGDAEFQKKCLGKMGDVSKGEGRTILFVSHNMIAVNSLCRNGIYIKDGKINNLGNVSEIINSYTNDYNKSKLGINILNNADFEFFSIQNNLDQISVRDNLILNLFFKSRKFKSKKVHIDFAIYNSSEIMVIHSKSKDIKLNAFEVCEYADIKVTFEVLNPNLSPGNYFLTIYLYEENVTDKVILWIEKIPINSVNNINPTIFNDVQNKISEIKSITYPKFEINLKHEKNNQKNI
jgi:lipopolysaccharide transport system ATP-binding protein